MTEDIERITLAEELENEVFDEFSGQRRKYSVHMKKPNLLQTINYYLADIKKIDQLYENFLERAKRYFDVISKN